MRLFAKPADSVRLDSAKSHSFIANLRLPFSTTSLKTTIIMATNGQSFYELYRRSRYCAYAILGCYDDNWLYSFSIGMALTDTLDDLISERRIEPQLAMKILANFDRSITEVLAEKVKARLTFKVHLTLHSYQFSGIQARVG
jgi:Transcription initiation factor IIA, gamma subunit, helical domain